VLELFTASPWDAADGDRRQAPTRPLTGDPPVRYLCRTWAAFDRSFL